MSSSKQIVRRPKAAEDVEAHAKYIAEDNLEAALRFLEHAEQTINELKQFPESGAPFPSRVEEFQGMRTKLVKDFPNHVIFYIEREDVIEVVRILRGGQDIILELENS